jgi:hypothetical protein
VRLRFVKSEGAPGGAFDRNTCSEPLSAASRYLEYTVGLTSGALVDVSNVRFSFINTLGDAGAGDTLVSTLKRGLGRRRHRP